MSLARSDDRLAEATREWARANLNAAEGGGGKGAVIEVEVRETYDGVASKRAMGEGAGAGVVVGCGEGEISAPLMFEATSRLAQAKRSTEAWLGWSAGTLIVAVLRAVRLPGKLAQGC